MTYSLERNLLTQIARANRDFRLIEPGDRVLVAVSGGKDSHAMLYLLRETQRRAPFDFSLIAVNIDQGHPGFPSQLLPEYFEREGYEYKIVREDTYSVVKEKVPAGKTYCSLCARMRRGILYAVAKELGATKIALGHHRDDACETLLLNLFYSGQLKAMPARLRSDDGVNIVIRPLITISEDDLRAFAELRQFPIVPCDLCGSQPNLKRQQMKRMLRDLARDNPKVPSNLFAALSNVRPTHLLDADLYKRLGINEAREEPEQNTEPPPEAWVPVSALKRSPPPAAPPAE